jgi:quinol-cytochrome oxidoreductase complex cytochrome b subunit
MERRSFIHRNLIFHFRPATVAGSTLRFTLSWGLGGMAMVLVMVQLATGILLKFAYDPTPASAHGSIQLLVSAAPFGRLIRNIHYWGANLLVPVIFLHMLRVFLTGAFHPPRQFNWIIGLFQFALVLGANFTGYLLPFDQLAYWAVTVSTTMLEYIPLAGTGLQKLILAGSQMGPRTLRQFYVLHTAVIPVFLGISMAFHFWRVRKAGGLVVTAGEKDSRFPAIPHLFVRETAVALSLLAFVMAMAVFLNAPLGDPANPGLSPNPTKAPWYFAGFQEILFHVHPVFAVFVIPLAAGIFFVMVPYLKYDVYAPGVWFVSQKGKRLAAIAGVGAVILTTGFIMVSERVVQPFIGAWGPCSMIRVGFIPFILIIVMVFGFYCLIRRKSGASKSESIQALFVFTATVFAVLTAVGAWFRGPHMALIFFG